MDKLHILVVDDNHINRLFFQSSLKKLNCVVTTAKDGFEAIAQCKLTAFDLILMDIRMNGMNGIESAALIKKSVNNSITPIVAISAETFDTDEHSDFSDSLLKPVKLELLAQTINQFTQRVHCFNHEKALKISHDNAEIVKHLRKLFVTQLNQVKTELISLYTTQNHDELEDALHKLLGSAKICAAELLIERIESYQLAVEKSQNDAEQRFNELLTAINQTIQS
ncbi:response regulator [Marinicella litoralis]|uniref:CheY-like chemotaxis protein n=1 Tax=Marinicella litoralis TaxID=644220 RepID=A0A4V3DHI0_9GAMM|nr:response regulator [Marinicella litoralis]TDR18311.1 CheY-like chemotaxis protein [Marinicella litoralis]